MGALRRGTGRLLAAGALGAVLVLAVALRLPGLAAPPFDGHHVRQCDTASIARIMARDGIDLLRPRIGWAGSPPGTVESELPLYAAAVAAGWRVAGSEEMAWPRALSLLVWMLGALPLGLFAARRLPEVPTAAALALYLLAPISLQFGRAIQPDALAVALLLAGLERADAAGRAGPGGARWAAVAATLVGLAIACKGTLAAFAPLLPILARAGGAGVSRRAAALAFGVAAALGGLWYAHAHTLGRDGASFKLWGRDAGKWTTELAEAPAQLATVLRVGIGLALTPLGAVLLLPGVLAARRRPEARPLLLGLALGAGSALLLLPGFATHSYYQLPLAALASPLVGLGALLVLRGARARRVVAVPVALGGILLAALTLRSSDDALRTALRQDRRVGDVAAAAALVLPSGVPAIVVDRHPQSVLFALRAEGFHRTELPPGELATLEAYGARALLVTDTSPSFADPGLRAELRAPGRRIVAEGMGWVLVRLRDGRAVRAPRRRVRRAERRGTQRRLSRIWRSSS